MEMKKEEEAFDRKSPFNFHTCDLCPFRTKSLGVMLSHVRKHQQKAKSDRFSCETANLELFKCQFCYFENSLKIASDRHVSLVHSEAQHPDPEIKLKCYICDKCEFETYSLLVFARHVCDDSQLCASITENETVSKHNAIKDISQYSYKLKKQAYLKSPILTIHTVAPPVTSECGDCSLKTKYKCSLKIHNSIKPSSPSNIKWFGCEHCSYKAKCKAHLTQHTLLKHTGPNEVKWFKCEHCSYKGKSNSRLKRHTLIKHSNSNDVKWFECEHCSYISKRKGNLTQHTLFKHTSPNEVKWFECEHCSYKAKVKAHLTQHTLLKHTGPNEVKWFECELCSYKGKSNSRFKQHTLIEHSCSNEVKWFECEHCSFKTKLKGYLRRHTLLKHSPRNHVKWLKYEHFFAKQKQFGAAHIK